MTTGSVPRILVIKHGALGDVVQALGPLGAIRAHHPGARITVLTAPLFASLFAAAPEVDEVWIDERPAFWRVGAWLALRRRLLGAGFERVYDLQTSRRSSLLFRLLGPGRRPEWSGIAPGCSHPHANPARDRMHTVLRQAEQLRHAGIAEVPAPDLSFLDAPLARYSLTAPFVLLVPGGSAARPAKRWPIERFAALAVALARDRIQPVVLGTVPERSLAATIQAACPATRDLVADTSFAEITALARAAAGAVGNDTGPLHLIAAADCPAVVLFSAESDPALCAPRGRDVRVLRRPHLEALGHEEVGAALAAILRRS